MIADTGPVDAASRLMLALDVPDIAQAKEIIGALDGIVSVFKVGPWLLMAEGFEGLVSELVRGGKQVFLDTKICDIPETMRAGIAAAAARGIHFLTIHGNDAVTDEAMRAAVAGKAAGDLKILVVTVLTSDASGGSGATGGAGASVRDVVLSRAQRALACGCDGVIASGREAQAVREMAGNRPFIIVTPGIRPADEATDDHKRAVTPASAIAAGADYLVVGRPIVRAADPAQAARRVITEMQEAFAKRG